MPQPILDIDCIARQKRRDVLYVKFYDAAARQEVRQYLQDCEASGRTPDEDDLPIRQWRQHREQVWQRLPVRQQVLQWLDAHGIGWQPCAEVNSRDRMHVSGYDGDIYIDVPYDEALPPYQLLEAYLENPDGSMRLPNVHFFYLPLEHAMQHAERDDAVCLDKP